MRAEYKKLHLRKLFYEDEKYEPFETWREEQEILRETSKSYRRAIAVEVDFDYRDA